MLVIDVGDEMCCRQVFDGLPQKCQQDLNFFATKYELRFDSTRLTRVIKFESTLDGSVGALWI